MTVERLSQSNRILRKLLAEIDKYSVLTFDSDQEKIDYYNLWADFGRSVIGVNVMPIFKKRSKEWSEWQDKPIPQSQHDAWKSQGAFKDGIVAIAGKVLHRQDKAGLYFVIIDLKSGKAVHWALMREMSLRFISEQQMDDKGKTIVCFYTGKLFQVPAKELCFTPVCTKRVARIFSLRKGYTLECLLYDKNLLIGTLDKQGNTTAAIIYRNPRSTGSKKRKALDQPGGPGPNAIPNTPSFFIDGLHKSRKTKATARAAAKYRIRYIRNKLSDNIEGKNYDG